MMPTGASCLKHGSPCGRWPISSAISRNGSSRSNKRSEPGTAAMKPAGVSPPSLGSAVLPPSAIVATVANATEFKSARHFAAFLGLTPKQCSTGGRQRLGRISKQGDVYIRRLLVLGGTSLVRYARGAGGSVWAKQLLARRPARIV